MSDAPLPDIRVVSRGATGDDAAAVTAVVAGALEELAAAAELEAQSHVSAWAQSQRQVRATLKPGAGAWRSFSG